MGNFKGIRSIGERHVRNYCDLRDCSDYTVKDDNVDAYDYFCTHQKCKHVNISANMFLRYLGRNALLTSLADLVSKEQDLENDIREVEGNEYYIYNDGVNSVRHMEGALDDVRNCILEICNVLESGYPLYDYDFKIFGDDLEGLKAIMSSVHYVLGRNLKIQVLDEFPEYFNPEYFN